MPAHQERGAAPAHRADWLNAWIPNSQSPPALVPSQEVLPIKSREQGGRGHNCCPYSSTELPEPQHQKAVLVSCDKAWFTCSLQAISPAICRLWGYDLDPQFWGKGPFQNCQSHAVPPSCRNTHHAGIPRCSSNLCISQAESTFFFKESTPALLLTLLKDDYEHFFASFHFIFGLCLKTNILFIFNRAHIQLICLRVLAPSSPGKNRQPAKGCHTVKSNNQGMVVGVGGLGNETCQLFFFLQQGIYEVKMSHRSPIPATARK